MRRTGGAALLAGNDWAMIALAAAQWNGRGWDLAAAQHGNGELQK